MRFFFSLSERKDYFDKLVLYADFNNTALVFFFNVYNYYSATDAYLIENGYFFPH